MSRTVFGRVLRTGLSSLRDRAAARLAALRFNPSRIWHRKSETVVEFGEQYLCAEPGYRARIFWSHQLPKEDCWIARLKDLEATLPK